MSMILDKTAKTKIVQTFPKEERRNESIKLQFQNKELQLNSTNHCRECWLPKEYCQCQILNTYHRINTTQSIDINKINIEIKINVIIIMNKFEIYRSTNTCNWFKQILNNQIVLQEEDGENQVNDLDISNTFIIFPSEESVNSHEFDFNICSQNNNTKITTDFKLPEKNIVNLVVIDGTWGKAKKINKRLNKEFKRIKIDFNYEKQVSKFKSRKQAILGRLSSMEAIQFVINYFLIHLGNLSEQQKMNNLQNDLKEIEKILDLFDFKEKIILTHMKTKVKVNENNERILKHKGDLNLVFNDQKISKDQVNKEKQLMKLIE